MPTRTAPTENETFDLEVLLGVLSDVKVGDFAARMPVHWTGMGGKAADGFNQPIGANQALGIDVERPELADLSIIAVTGKVVDGESARCLAAGASDYIPKPVDTAELLQALSHWFPPHLGVAPEGGECGDQRRADQ